MSSYHHGKFTWFEHSSSDPAKARAFYEALFGWKIAPMPIGAHSYDLVRNADEGIGGIVSAVAGAPSRWISYLSVSDVDESFAAAIALGATAVMRPTDVPPVGRGAELIDPTGAAVSLWKNAQGDRGDRDKLPAGDWVWNELLTQDVARALAFYEGAFGYTHEEIHIGPQGKYYILKGADGKGRAGVMKAPHADMPAAWTPYVKVEQADATAARVAPLGGTLLMQPQDVPAVGRLGALADPTGAAIAFIQPVVMA